MIPLLSLLFFFLPLLLNAQEGEKQQPIEIGLSGSGSLAPIRLLSGEASIYNGSPDCGTFSSGSVQGWGGQLRTIIPFATSLHLKWSVGYGTTHYRLSTTSDQGTWLFDQDVNAATEIEREFSLDVETGAIETGVAIGFALPHSITLDGGLFAGYAIAHETTQTDRILGPGDIAFADGQTSRQMIEGPTYTPQPFSFGPEVNVGYRLPIGPRLTLLPEAGFRVGLLSPLNETGRFSWTSPRFQLSLGILYMTRSLGPEIPAVPPPLALLPTPPVAPPPINIPDPSPRLSAAIDIYTMVGEEKSKRIDVLFDEVDECSMAIFAPTIEFSGSGTDLPNIYRSWNRSTRPSFDSLLALDPRQLQGHLLDLVGARMLRNGEATLLLLSSNDQSSSSRRRDEERVESIRSYLEAVWEIAPDRISSERRDDLRTKNSITILPSTSDILAPVTRHRLDRDFAAPTLKVKTSQEVEAGLKSWEITLTNDEKEIARYSSLQPEGNGGGINWDVLYREAALDSSGLQGIFMIEDSTGARTIASSEATMIVRKNRISVRRLLNFESGSERILYSIAGSGYREIDSIGYRRIAEMAEDVLQQGSRGNRSLRIASRSAGGSGEKDQIDSRLQPYSPSIVPPATLLEELQSFERCMNDGEGILPESVVVIEQEI